MQTNDFIEVAIKAAQSAEIIINQYYRQQLDIQLKADNSPVTIADIEAEKIIKTVLSTAFPEHGFYGEETGYDNDQADYVWLIDPIDGTKSFIRQYPFFSTQIALLHQGELIVGVSNAPAFGEIAYAGVGTGALLNAQRIRVSKITALANASLSVGNIASLAQSSRWLQLGKLIPEVNRIRGYGDFLHYHLLAAGKIDLIIESDVNILDIAALTVIIREAGGVLTDLDGNAPTLSTTSVLAANSLELHQQVLELLAG